MIYIFAFSLLIYFLYISSFLSISPCYLPDSSLPINSTGNIITSPLARLKVSHCYTIDYVNYGNGYKFNMDLVISYLPYSYNSAYNVTITSSLLNDISGTLSSIISNSPVENTNDIAYSSFSNNQNILFYAPYFYYTSVNNISINLVFKLNNPIIKNDILTSTFNLTYQLDDGSIITSYLKFYEKLYYSTNKAPIISSPYSISFLQSTWFNTPYDISDSDFFNLIDDPLIKISISTSLECMISIPNPYIHPLYITSSNYNEGPDEIIGSNILNFTSSWDSAVNALRNLRVTCSSPGTFNFYLSVYDNFNGGVGAEGATSLISPLNSMTELSTIYWVLPTSVDAAEGTNATLSTLGLFDLNNRADIFKLTIWVKRSGIIVDIPGSLFDSCADSTFDCISINGTLPQLNATLSIVTIVPTQNFNKVRDGGIKLFLSLGDFVNYIVPVEAEIDILFWQVNTPPIIYYPALIYYAYEGVPFYIHGVTIRDNDVLESYDSKFTVILALSPSNCGKISINSTVGIYVISPSLDRLEFNDLSRASYYFKSSNLISDASASIITSDTIIFQGDEQVLSYSITPGLLFTPTDGFNGNATLTLAVSDNGNSGTGGSLWTNTSFTIQVKPVNQPPVLISSYNSALPIIIHEEYPYFIGLSFTDDSAGNFTIEISSNNGRFTLPSNGLLQDIPFSSSFCTSSTYYSYCGGNETYITFSCTLSYCNDLISNISFVPNTNLNGLNIWLNFSVSDNGESNGIGGIQSSVALYVFNTIAVNDAPNIHVTNSQLTINTLTGFALGQYFFIDDVDVSEGGTELLHVWMNVTQGTLSFNNGHLGQGLNYILGTGYNDSILEFYSSIDTLQVALSTLIYYANSPAAASDILNIYVEDNGNYGIGGNLNSRNQILFTLVSGDKPLIFNTSYEYNIYEDIQYQFYNLSVYSIDPLPFSSNISIQLSVTHGNLSLALAEYGGLLTTLKYISSSDVVSLIGDQNAINSVLSQLIFIPELNYNLACCGGSNLNIIASYIGFGMKVNESIESSITIPLIVHAINDVPIVTFSGLSTNENREVRLDAISIFDDAGEVFDGRVSLQLTVSNGLLRIYDLVSCNLIVGTAPYNYINARSVTESDVTSGVNGDSLFGNELIATLGDLTIHVECLPEIFPQFLYSVSYVPNFGFSGNEILRVNVSDLGYYGTGGIQTFNDAFPIVVNRLGYFPPQLSFVSNHSYLFVMEDSPSIVSLKFDITTGSSLSSLYYVTIIAQNGAVSFYNNSGYATIDISHGNSTIFSPQYSVNTTDFNLGLFNVTQYSTLCLLISNVNFGDSFYIDLVYSSEGNWNSISRGPDVLIAFGQTMEARELQVDVLPYDYYKLSFLNYSELNIITIASNDPLQFVVPIGTFLTPESTPLFLNAGGDEDFSSNNYFLVYDVDIDEYDVDAFVYFEIYSNSPMSLIRLNSTEGIYFLSNQSVSYLHPFDTTTSAPITDYEVIKVWMKDGSNFFAGFSNVMSLSRSLRGLRFLPGIDVFSDVIHFSVTDLGKSSTCLNIPTSFTTLSTYFGSNPILLNTTLALTAYLFQNTFMDAYNTADALSSWQPIDGGQLFNTTSVCSSSWQWVNKSIAVNMTGINQSPRMRFTTSSDNWGLSVVVSNPLTFSLFEDSWFYLPSLILSDREVLLCPNTSTSNNFTIIFNATYGTLSLSPSLSFTTANNDWIILGSGVSNYNSSNIVVYCSYSKCQSVLQGISFLPTKNYNGFESSLFISAIDDGGCSFFNGGSQSTFLPIYFEISSLDDAPVIYANYSTSYGDFTILSSDPSPSCNYFTAENVNLVLSGSTGLRVDDVDISETEGALINVRIGVSRGKLSFKSLLDSIWLSYFSPYLPGISWRQSLPPASLLDFDADLVSLNHELSNGIVYIPDKYYCGNCSFFIEVTSQRASVYINSTITVKCVDTPLSLAVPANYSGFESLPFLITGIVVSSIDTISTLLTVTAAVKIGVLSIYAPILSISVANNFTSTITVTGSYSDISTVLLSNILYTSPKYINGWDYLTLTISYISQNGLNSSILTSLDSSIPIYIIPVNNAPILYFVSNVVATTSNSYTAVINSSLALASSKNYLFNVTMNSAPISIDNVISLFDQDLDEENSLGFGVFQVNISCYHCAFVFKSMNGLAVISGSLLGGSAIVQGGTKDMNFALSSLQYKPVSNYWGLDTIFITISDMGYTGSGYVRDSNTRIPLYDSGSISINVTYINAAPVIPFFNFYLTTLEDSSLSLPAFNFTHLNHPPIVSPGYNIFLNVSKGVLASNSIVFPNLQSSSSSLLNINVLMNSNGSTGSINIVSSNTTAIFAILSNLIYTPNPNLSGVDLLYFRVIDLADDQFNEITLGIGIDAVNDAPQLSYLNSSYFSITFDVFHDIPALLPKISLVDIDADDSQTPMSLTVSALYGSLAVASPDNYGSWGLSANVNFSQTLQLSGSLETLQVDLQYLVYKSPANSTARNLIFPLESFSGISDASQIFIISSSLYPAFQNDTIYIHVSDNGASADVLSEANPLTSFLYINVTITKDLIAPVIINNVPNPIQINENTSYIIPENLLYLRSGDLESSPSTVIKALFHLSVDAVTIGIDLQFGLYCPAFTKSSSATVHYGLNINEPSGPPFLKNMFYANQFNLIGSVTYTCDSFSLSTLNTCFSNISITTSSPFFYGTLNEAISLYIERTDSNTAPNVKKFNIEYIAVNNDPIITADPIVNVKNNIATMLPPIVISDIDFKDVYFTDSLLNVTLTVYNGTLTLFAAESINLLYPTPLDYKTISSQVRFQSIIKFSLTLNGINNVLSSIFYNSPTILNTINPCGYDTLHIEVNDLGTYGSGGSLDVIYDQLIYINCVDV